MTRLRCHGEADGLAVSLKDAWLAHALGPDKVVSSTGCSNAQPMIAGEISGPRRNEVRGGGSDRIPARCTIKVETPEIDGADDEMALGCCKPCVM